MLGTTPAPADINDTVAQLDIDTANLQDVIAIFGEPSEYVWGDQTFDASEVPVAYYCLPYPNGFDIYMRWNYVIELRFQSPETGYVFRGEIEVGLSLEDVLDMVGEPTETVVGGPNGWEDGVLYKDIDGTTGYCYYRRADQNVRFFFLDYHLSGLYVTRSDYDTFVPPTPVTSVHEYEDVRSKDLSNLDLSNRPELPATLTFNQETIWEV